VCVFIYLLPRCMRPEGPWQRLRRCLSSNGQHTQLPPVPNHYGLYWGTPISCTHSSPNKGKRKWRTKEKPDSLNPRKSPRTQLLSHKQLPPADHSRQQQKGDLWWTWAPLLSLLCRPSVCPAPIPAPHLGVPEEFQHSLSGLLMPQSSYHWRPWVFPPTVSAHPFPQLPDLGSPGLALNE